VASAFGRYIGRKGSMFITVGCIFLTAAISSVAFYEVALSSSCCYLQTATWIDSAMLHASWGFMFDPLTSVMTIVVSYVSALVHLYSMEYMSHDPHIQRFMSYLSLFTFFMLLLIASDNFIQMFIGWEGVGLASFLLINFWTTRLQANKAAMKALIVNRIGDFGLCLGIFSIYFVYGAVDYSTVFAMSGHISDNSVITMSQADDFYVSARALICACLFIGAVGKSAQIGLHTWLPDAMEGPTPVSALIHAATMVTAGVFLIVRCSPIFEYAPSVLAIITFFGAVTSFFAATTGAFQNDLKRVIAYSTCSQLGYMIFACGISSYSATMYHLANHAFFKALLFLSAGSIIHGLHDEQDMRKMGSLNRILPFTYTMTLIGSLALIGFPFLTGYYSKDFILELAGMNLRCSGSIAYWLGTLSVSFTTFYSYRLVFLTFLNKTNAFARTTSQAHEPGIIMSLPLMLLAAASVFIGYLGKDMIIGVGSAFWGNSLLILSKNMVFIDAEYLPYHIKIIPLVFSHLGIFFAYNIASWNFVNGAYQQRKLSLHIDGKPGVLTQIHKFFSHCWNFNDFYNRFIVFEILSFGHHISFRLFDAGWIAYLGPYGIARTIEAFTWSATNLQTGYVYHYAYIILSATLLFLFGSIGLDAFQHEPLYFVNILTFLAYRRHSRIDVRRSLITVPKSI
jgi:proton-translocating NADH-quinone oxidoreductase chain L